MVSISILLEGPIRVKQKQQNREQLPYVPRKEEELETRKSMQNSLQLYTSSFMSFTCNGFYWQVNKGSQQRSRTRQMWQPNPGTLCPNSDPEVFATVQLAEK